MAKAKAAPVAGPVAHKGQTVMYIHSKANTPGGIDREHPAMITAVLDDVEQTEFPRVNLMVMYDARQAAPKVRVQHQSQVDATFVEHGFTWRYLDEQPLHG